MKNFIQPGDNLEVTAPAAVVSGEAILIQDLFGVCAMDAASGEKVTLVTKGVFELPKESAAVFALGQKVHWDDATKKCDDNGSHPQVGFAVEAAIAGASSVKVKLL